MVSFKIKLRNKIRIDEGNTVNISPKAQIKNCKIQIQGRGNTLTIGEGCKIRFAKIEILGEDCELSIGKNFENSGHIILSCRERGKRLVIGENGFIADGVRIRNSDSHPIYAQGQRVNPAASVIIGNNVWISDGAMVLKGVTIGDNAVIGARSLVTKDIDPQTVSVGVPAKVIRRDITWERKLVF